jgi:hypothetical protein
MGAVASAVTVVGGLVGIGRQSSAARAQKNAIKSQQEIAAREAQLNLLQLKNQQMANQVTDYIDDATRRLQYQQSMAALDNQQQLNNIAVNSALVDAQVQQQMAGVSKQGADIQAGEQKLAADRQTTQQFLQQLSASGEATGQLGANILQALGAEDVTADQIASLLNVAASTGGINEALALFADRNQATGAQGQFAQVIDREQAKVDLSSQIADKQNRANQLVFGMSTNMAGAQEASDVRAANDLSSDARVSKVLADAGFNTQRATMRGNFGIMEASNAANRFARDYLAAYQERAVADGAKVNQDVLEAQRRSIRTPGFFDVLGVGLDGYNAYTKFNKLTGG